MGGGFGITADDGREPLPFLLVEESDIELKQAISAMLIVKVSLRVKAIEVKGRLAKIVSIMMLAVKKDAMVGWKLNLVIQKYTRTKNDVIRVLYRIPNVQD